MPSIDQKDYIVVVQCDLVMQRCSGYACERAFHERTGGFAVYPAERPIRTLYLTCGGCCGRPLHRKLAHLVKTIRVREGVEKQRIAVQLASCITKDNCHGPACPHLSYLKVLIGKLALDFREDTHISTKAQERRAMGIYKSGKKTS